MEDLKMGMILNLFSPHAPTLNRLIPCHRTKEENQEVSNVVFFFSYGHAFFVSSHCVSVNKGCQYSASC